MSQSTMNCRGSNLPSGLWGLVKYVTVFGGVRQLILEWDRGNRSDR